MFAPKSRFVAESLAAQVERVVELTQELTTEHVGAFDQGIGVSEDCLSSQKIYDLLMGGANQRDREHLMSCLTCRENLSLLSQVRLEPRPDFIVKTLEQARSESNRKVAKHQPMETGFPIPAILARETRTVRVDPRSTNQLTIVFDVIPGFAAALLKDVDLLSFKVEGALRKPTSVTVELVDVDDDNEPDSLRVRIDGAMLAPRVLKSLLNHQRVIDTVRLRARFLQGKRREFAGQANLEFHE
jgi:hypothetical protein